MFIFVDQLKFDRPHETVSVVVGKRALLPCYVSIQDVNNELRTNNGQSPFKVMNLGHFVYLSFSVDHRQGHMDEIK